jgi:hypothetical protein
MPRVGTFEAEAKALVARARELSKEDLVFAMTVKAIAISDLPEARKVETFRSLLREHVLPPLPSTRP